MVIIACEGKLCDRRQFRRRGTPKPACRKIEAVFAGVPLRSESDSIGFCLHQFGFEDLLVLTITHCYRGRTDQAGAWAHGAVPSAVPSTRSVAVTAAATVAIAVP